MATEVKRRRGTTAEHTSFTGALAEVTVDTTKDTVVVHDGATAGGFPLLREDGSNSALALGSAGTPSLKFTGDPNTGLYSPGADLVAISTAGAERVRVDTSGNLLIGASTARTNFNNTTDSAGVQIEGTTPTTRRVSITSGETAVSGGAIILAHQRSGTIGGNTILQQNDSFGAVGFDGSDGTDFVRGALIIAEVDGTPGANDMPGRLAFWTTADGASTPTERLRITSTGSVGIGTLTPGGTLDIKAAAATAPLIVQGTASEFARIDSSGRLLVGTSTARTSAFFNGTFGSLFQVEGSGVGATDEKRIHSHIYGAAAIEGPYLVLAKHRSGLVGGITLVAADDQLGALSFQGADGTDFVEAARIQGFVDGTPGANDMPGRLVFSTAADGASTLTEQLRITSGGTVVYNQPAPAAVNTTATLTVANLAAKIITSTTAAAVTMTLPTGTDMDAGFANLYTNMAFEWSVINTGATNAVTVQGGTGHTVVGSGTVAASNSGRFVSRRTAATTWVSYRLSS